MASSDLIKSAHRVTERGAGQLVAGRYRLARKIGWGAWVRYGFRMISRSTRLSQSN